MSDDKNTVSDGGDNIDDNEPQTRLSLEQALLAPLDSILKAQLHSARSFLNLLLQLGYPHQQAASGTDDEKHKSTGQDDGRPYSLSFDYVQDNQRQRVSVPALALVPISPLAVDSASFHLEMSARRVIKQTQMRESEKDRVVSQQDGETFDRYRRPWFLVDKPVNIEGDIVSMPSGEAAKHRESQSAIRIDINVKSIPLPAGLDKLLTSLTSMSTVEVVGPVSPGADDSPDSGPEADTQSRTDP